MPQTPQTELSAFMERHENIPLMNCIFDYDSGLVLRLLDIYRHQILIGVGSNSSSPGDIVLLPFLKK